MVFCNTTLEDLSVDGEEKYSMGLTIHEIGLIVSAVFGLISLVIADAMVLQHARHYLKPQEQKHIIRILLMIPIYSTVSFLSYYYYYHAIYFDVLRDCYEAFAIASFFTLLCNYIAPSLHDQKDYFRQSKPKNWVWPIPWLQYITGGKEKGWFRIPRSGLTWFNIIYVGVFQYCFIRVLFTLVSVITEHWDRYCEDSLSPAFAHIWVECFEGVSVTIAMYALIQFYVQLREEIAEHRPFLKLLCIKLVIFFSFWQTLVISFLTSRGTISTGPHVKYPDISIGLPSMLLCIEMAVFAVMHIFAFSWKPYRIPGGASRGVHKDSITSFDQGSGMENLPGSGISGTPHYIGGFFGLKAMGEAINPWDIVKASARGFRWLFVGVRHREEDASYVHPAGADTSGKDYELRNHTPTNGGGQTNGTTYLQPQPNLGRSVSPGRAFRSGGTPDNYTGAGYPRESSPYPTESRVKPSWPARRNFDDNGAWHVDGPGIDSRGPSQDINVEDRSGLLRHAGQPGYNR